MKILIKNFSAMITTALYSLQLVNCSNENEETLPSVLRCHHIFESDFRLDGKIDFAYLRCKECAMPRIEEAIASNCGHIIIVRRSAGSNPLFSNPSASANEPLFSSSSAGSNPLFSNPSASANEPLFPNLPKPTQKNKPKGFSVKGTEDEKPAAVSSYNTERRKDAQVESNDNEKSVSEEKDHTSN